MGTSPAHETDGRGGLHCELQFLAGISKSQGLSVTVLVTIHQEFQKTRAEMTIIAQ
jgi:hypothetical protein